MHPFASCPAENLRRESPLQPIEMFLLSLKWIPPLEKQGDPRALTIQALPSSHFSFRAALSLLLLLFSFLLLFASFLSSFSPRHAVKNRVYSELEAPLQQLGRSLAISPLGKIERTNRGLVRRVESENTIHAREGCFRYELFANCIGQLQKSESTEQRAECYRFWRISLESTIK